MTTAAQNRVVYLWPDSITYSGSERVNRRNRLWCQGTHTKDWNKLEGFDTSRLADDNFQWDDDDHHHDYDNWWTLNKYSQQPSCKNEPDYCEKSKMMVTSYELCIDHFKSKIDKSTYWVIIIFWESLQETDTSLWLRGVFKQVWDHPPQLPSHTLHLFPKTLLSTATNGHQH